MKKGTLIGLFVSLLFFLSGCGFSHLSKNEFKEVLKEMILLDLNLEDHPSYKLLADSTWVYPSLLEEKGYTLEQFENSIHYYSQKPEIFRSLLLQLRKSINDEKTQLNKDLLAKREKEAKMTEFKSELARMDSTSFNWGWAQSYKRILPHHPSSDAQWRADSDSTYVAPELRVLPVISARRFF